MGRNYFKEWGWVKKKGEEIPLRFLRWGLSQSSTCVNCYSVHCCSLPAALASVIWLFLTEFWIHSNPESFRFLCLSLLSELEVYAKINYFLFANLPLHELFNHVNCFSALNITNILISKVAEWGPVKVHCWGKFMFLEDCLSLRLKKKKSQVITLRSQFRPLRTRQIRRDVL